MKKAVLIIAFIFILLSISQVSAVLVYNSARSNVSNRILEDVWNDVGNLLKEVKKAEPREVKAELREVSSGVIQFQLKGSWDELEVPCDFREELELEECESASSQREATLGTFQKGRN